MLEEPPGSGQGEGDAFAVCEDYVRAFGPRLGIEYLHLSVSSV